MIEDMLELTSLTPMMQQYVSIKQNHADALLLYRLGDFYESFFDDARTVSKILNIVLTNRGADIPMCGIPHHALDNYLPRLVRAGYKVAICEQLETPGEAKKRGYKSVIRREVTRIITPGTIVDESMLDSASNNYLAALFFVHKGGSLFSNKTTQEHPANKQNDHEVGYRSVSSYPAAPTDRLSDTSLSDSARAAGYKSAQNDDTEQQYVPPTAAKAITKAGAIDDNPTSSAARESGGSGESSQHKLREALPPDAVDFLESAKVAIAWADISTGEFSVNTVYIANLLDELYRIMPQELILPDDLAPILETLLNRETLCSMTRRPDQMFHLDRVRNNITEHYGVAFTEGLGDFTNDEIAAAGALLEYVTYTQKSCAPLLKRPTKIQARDYMQIDQTTRRGLELCSSIRGEHRNTLFSVINFAETPFGRRLLKNNIVSPLTNVEAIRARLENVRWLVENPEVRQALMKSLGQLPDIERLIVKISTKRFTAKDLWAIRQAFSSILTICEILYDNKLCNGLIELRNQLGGLEIPRAELEKAIRPSILTSEENLETSSFIQPDYDRRLDQLYMIKASEIKKLDTLADKYRKLTGVENLRIQYNNVIGYFVESSPKNAESFRNSPFKHKQSLGNSVRYKTDELQDTENHIRHHNESIQSIEDGIIQHLGNMILQFSEAIGIATFALAKIDVASSLAQCAAVYGYNCPTIVDDNKEFVVQGGRHPVVERSTDSFCPNDCALFGGLTTTATTTAVPSSVIVLTGPNMAGKSTFLRQNALICILAQMGSYVPATAARLGVVDAIFSRIGSADDIARGQSTFMIEMLETANILNNATERSLLILDEVGRGTSTYDGLAIAHAILSDIHDRIGARTIFATHYHELNQVATNLSRCSCYHLEILEQASRIFFTHRVRPGYIDRSYGIHVAALAGMPPQVIALAQKKLDELLCQ